MGKRVVLAICVLLAGHGVGWAQTGDAARDDLLVIPGAPADYWKAAALIGPAPEGPRFLLEFIRALEAMEIHDTVPAAYGLRVSRQHPGDAWAGCAFVHGSTSAARRCVVEAGVVERLEPVFRRDAGSSREASAVRRCLAEP